MTKPTNVFFFYFQKRCLRPEDGERYSDDMKEASMKKNCLDEVNLAPDLCCDGLKVPHPESGSTGLVTPV